MEGIGYIFNRSVTELHFIDDCNNNEVDFVRSTLLSFGDDVEKKKKWANLRDKDGDPVLHNAVRFNQYELASK